MSAYQGHIVITKYPKQHFLSIEVFLDMKSIPDDSFIMLGYNINQNTRKILDDYLCRNDMRYDEFVIEFYASQTEMNMQYIRQSLNKIAEALQYAHIDINPKALLYETNSSTH